MSSRKQQYELEKCFDLIDWMGVELIKSVPNISLKDAYSYVNSWFADYTKKVKNPTERGFKQLCERNINKMRKELFK